MDDVFEYCGVCSGNYVFMISEVFVCGCQDFLLVICQVVVYGIGVVVCYGGEQWVMFLVGILQYLFQFMQVFDVWNEDNVYVIENVCVVIVKILYYNVLVVLNVN